MWPLRHHVSRRGLQFVVEENFITYHSMYSETSNYHEEADQLLIHCITSSKLDGKCAWVYANEVNVAVLLIAHHNLLSCKNVTLESVLKRLSSIVFLSFFVVYG